MQVWSELNRRPLEAATLSLCVAAAMLAGCNPVTDSGRSVENYETYGAGTIGAYEMELSRFTWPRMLLEAR
jgi:hypothetical protein